MGQVNVLERAEYLVLAGIGCNGCTCCGFDQTCQTGGRSVLLSFICYFQIIDVVKLHSCWMKCWNFMPRSYNLLADRQLVELSAPKINCRQN